MSNKKENKAIESIKLAFVGNNREYHENIPQLTSKITNRTDYVSWGDNNKYNLFLTDLFEKSPTLSSIVRTITDFVVGNEINSNKQQDEIEDIIYNLIFDYILYGNSYINILRNTFNQVVEIKYINANYIRVNEDCSVFFYSKDWNKSYGKVKTIAIPKYDETNDAKSSILMFKNNKKDIYSTPIYYSCINAILTETEISKFHLNEILNNFSASAIINMNNGQPTEEQIEEIERKLTDKFTGSENAGRFVLSFNNNKDSETTIVRLSTDDYADRYDSLEKSIKQQIFTCFRMNPNLIGYATENNGFNSEEYKDVFNIFNRTQIKPIQKKLVNLFSKIGYNIEIKPFSIDEDNNKEEIVD